MFSLDNQKQSTFPQLYSLFTATKVITLKQHYLYLQPKRRDFCLLVGYYAKRGDKHSARATFESMRGIGIDPSSYAFTRLVKTLQWGYHLVKHVKHLPALGSGFLICLMIFYAYVVYFNVVGSFYSLIHAYAVARDMKTLQWGYHLVKLVENFPAFASGFLICLLIFYTYVVYFNVVCSFYSLIHAYAVARDMKGAISCFTEMVDEGIKPTIATYCILISGFGKEGNAE